MAKIIDFRASKKKKNNDHKINNDALFDKKADIYTKNGNKYHIEKNRVYICGSDYYGKVYTITSDKYSSHNEHIIKHIYPYEDNRFRFLLVNLKNAKKYKTIEKMPTGDERPINIIEYEESNEYVCSIGDIEYIDSDLVTIDYKKKNNPKYIKKYILKPEKENKKDKDNKKKSA